MTYRKAIDVLVIGAGPTGATLAIDLARRGLDIRIVDKASQAFEGSRAKGLQPRTLEVLHDLGVLGEILAQGGLYPKLGLHAGPLTIPWRMFRNREPTADVPFPNTWLIPQFRTDGALHARLSKLGPTVEFGRELVDFCQGPEMVTARVSAAGGVEEIAARYLVGADGGSSAVRRQLGLDFVGTTNEQDRIVVVDAVVAGLSRDRWHMWPGRRGKFVGACPLPHSELFQWMIRLAPGEELPVTEVQINERVRAHTSDSSIVLRDVRWMSVFRPNIRLAERYRHGRVLIAGDAAHVHTPAGAQGLNTGIQDAYNLGWKLAQVSAGADDLLLDSYEAERLPIAARVLGLSTKKYDAISKFHPSSIRRSKDVQQLALSYHAGPLAPCSCDRTRTLRVGDRAPDADLLDANGVRLRLFDVYRGPHFTAIAYGARAALALNQLEWPATGARLERVIVDTCEGRGGRAPSLRTFRQNYGLTEETLLLIRPDGYVGHIATHEMLTTTQTAARTMTPAAKSREKSASSDSAPRAGALE